MDIDAIGDSVKNKLKAIRMDNDEFADEDGDDEELDHLSLSVSLKSPKIG
jgi:hypothetical protein